MHLSYRPDDRLGLHLLVPRVEIDKKEAGQEDVHLEGLGDVSFYLDWSPWEGEEKDFFDYRNLEFLAGLKLPTGEEADLVQTGLTPPSLLQLGTGTYDPLVGIRYRARAGRFEFFQSVAAQVSGGASEAGLKPGHLLQVATGVSHPVWEGVSAGIAVEGLFRDKDVLDGAEVANTGSAIWFATPSVSARLADGFFLEGSVRVPFYFNVDRTQLVPGPLWTVGLAVSF